MICQNSSDLGVLRWTLVNTISLILNSSLIESILLRFLFHRSCSNLDNFSAAFEDDTSYQSQEYNRDFTLYKEESDILPLYNICLLNL